MEMGLTLEFLLDENAGQLRDGWKELAVGRFEGDSFS
jgi:hypothetical protein